MGDSKTTLKFDLRYYIFLVLLVPIWFKLLSRCFLKNFCVYQSAPTVFHKAVHLTNN